VERVERERTILFSGQLNDIGLDCQRLPVSIGAQLVVCHQTDLMHRPPNADLRTPNKQQPEHKEQDKERRRKTTEKGACKDVIRFHIHK